MKKYLNFSSVSLLVLAVSFNTSGCNKTIISSLENANGYIIAASNPKIVGFEATQYADITYWSNKTIDSTHYKSIFGENLFDNLKSGSGQLDYFNLITLTSGKIDADAHTVAPDNSSVSIAKLLLAKYEIQSTNPKIKNLKEAYLQYNQDFNISYFQDKKEIKNNSDLKVVEIKNKFNTSKTFCISFSVNLIVTEQGKKDGFVGARTFIKRSPNLKTDISSYYQDLNKQKFLVDVNDKNLVGYNKEDKKIYYTNNSDFDYRFSINLVFTINL